MEECQNKISKIYRDIDGGSVEVLLRTKLFPTLFNLKGFSFFVEMILQLLIAITAAKSCTGDANLYERDEVESLNEMKNLQIFGDSVVILPKNGSKSQDGILDDSDDYVSGYVIRIRSPFDQDRYYNIEMKDLTESDEGEARSRELLGLKKILLPIVFALIIKLALLIPIFTAFVTLIAVKGFWAGMTALFVSKAIALKVLHQAENKHDHDHEDHDEYEDRDEYHEHHDHHDHHPPRPHRHHPSYETTYHSPREQANQYYGERQKPIVIYLNSDGEKAKSENRHEETSDVNNYYSSQAWNPWGRENLDFERQRWENGSPNWGQGPWSNWRS